MLLNFFNGGITRENGDKGSYKVKALCTIIYNCNVPIKNTGKNKVKAL